MDRRQFARELAPGSALSLEAGLTDRLLTELLANPEADRAGAFAEILRRYGSLVWGVCRRSLGDGADCEDAFQATLLALLEHPHKVRRAKSLPAWLHGVALRICLKLKRGEARLRNRSVRAARPERTASVVADAAWARAERQFDEELARLPTTLRTAFLACERSAEPQAVVARRLGWPVGTLSARHSRARARLESRLRARQLLPAVAVASLLPGGAALAGFPWLLVKPLAPLLLPTATRALLSPTLFLLAREGVMMHLTRLKLLALGTVATAGVGLNVGPLVLAPAEAQDEGNAKPKVEARERPRAAPPGNDEGDRPRRGRPEAPTPPPPPEAPGLQGRIVVSTSSPPAKFEYEVVELPKSQAELKAFLKKKGDAGWEYAGNTVIQEGDDKTETMAIFKRQTGPQVIRMTSPQPGVSGMGGFPGVPGMRFERRELTEEERERIMELQRRSQEQMRKLMEQSRELMREQERLMESLPLDPFKLDRRDRLPPSRDDDRDERRGPGGPGGGRGGPPGGGGGFGGPPGGSPGNFGSGGVGGGPASRPPAKEKEKSEERRRD